MLLAVVLPMTIQNLISSAVNMADVVMLGYVSQSALSASSLANQIQFILFLFYSGVSSGIIIMAAQYWGKGDRKTIGILFGMALKFSMVVSLVFGLGAFLAPGFLMHIFTNDPELIETGAVYLRIIGISYIFMGFTQVYECIIKSIERVKTATTIAAVTLFINIFLNATFIFGLFGAPKLGILGVAIATLISRIIEFVICLVDGIRQKDIEISRQTLSKWSNALFTDFKKYSLPALGNEFLWGAGFSCYSIVLGHMGSDIVAANSIISSVRDLSSVFVFGLAYGSAIVIGKEIGKGNTDEIMADGRRVIKLTFWSSLAAGVLIILIEPIIFKFTSLSSAAQGYLGQMVYINCVYMMGMGLNTSMICGLFRSGGDARYGFILDTICMWVISVPCAFLTAFVFHFPPVLVYVVTCMDEFIKLPINLIHFKKGKWIKNITRSEDEI